MTLPWIDYVAKHMDDDTARWLGGEHMQAVDEDVRPVTEFLATLPSDAARVLKEWDRRARAGTIPFVIALEDYQYGDDLAAAGIPVTADGEEMSSRVWSLGHDGGGNLYLVLPSGKVQVWDHETEKLCKIAFPSLDAFAWALVLQAAADKGSVSREEAIQQLKQYAEQGFGFEYFTQRLAD